MAEYSDTTLIVKGSKKAVVGFLNRGLKGNKSKGRIPVRKTGEEIVALLNGLEKPMQMGSYLPRPKTFDTWDTTNDLNDLYQWYLRGCVRHSDSEILDQRVSEIQDFMEAHPADFQKVPLERDPIFSNPDDPEVTYGFEYVDKVRALRMLHPELIQEYEKYVRGYKRAKAYQQKNYGVVGWYDWNVKNYGCKWDEKFENWELKRERDDSIVLSAQMETPWAVPMAFIEYINQIEGVTIYAYGGKTFSYFFSYNGRTGKVVWKDPDKDSRYDRFKKDYEKSEDYDSEWAPYAIADMIIVDYVETFKAELEKEFLTD
jgi:hypothetical protein